MPWKIIDKQDRGVLGEGRNYGIGYAFAKRNGKTLTTVMPISPCKDYLNDIVYSEITGKPYQAYGLKTSKKDIFDKSAYLIAAVCKQGCRTLTEYDGYKEDVKSFNENYKNIQSALNDIEELLKLPEKTVIDKVDDNLMAITVPLFWVKGTYLISLYTLLLRAAIKYKKGDPIAYWEKVTDGDIAYLKNALPKLKKMIAGDIPAQDFTGSYSWHNLGIVTFNQFK